MQDERKKSIDKVFDIQVTDDGYIEVCCMEPAGKSSFKWPEREDVHKYLTYNILCQIDAPTPIN